MSYRVTNRMMQNLLLNDMHTNLSKLLDIQQQLSTQRKYQSATENPNAVTKGMNLETMMTESEQYKENLEDAISWLKFTDTALGDMNDIFHRIRELAIYAGDGALEGVDLEAISVEVSELKKQLMAVANSTIAGEYLFAGLKTATTPFEYGLEGDVVYKGNDYAVKWEFSRKEIGKVSVPGSELFPPDETTYRLKSFEVPLDFEWKGRNEKIEFKVGWQTVSVRIPEKWKDETVNGLDDYGDYNRYRDSGELEGWSLKEIADMINNSTEMGDVSKLLKASVVTDPDRNVQYLVIKSLTGEPVRITSWPDTDPVWLSQGIKGAAYGDAGRTADTSGRMTIKFSDGITQEIDVAKGDTLEKIAAKLNGLNDGRLWAAVKRDGGNEWLDVVWREQHEDIYFNIDSTGGAVSLMTPQMKKVSSHKEGEGRQVIRSNEFDANFKTYASGDFTIEIDGKRYTAAVPKDTVLTATGLKTVIEGAVDDAGSGLPTGVDVKADGGVLEIFSTIDPNMQFNVIATGGLVPLYSDGAYALSTTVADVSGDYTAETVAVPEGLKLTGDGALFIEINGVRHSVEIAKDDTMEKVVENINKIAGLTATHEFDVDENGDHTEYIKIIGKSKMTISGFGSGGALVGSHFVGSEAIQTNSDHSHIGFVEFMGLETALKSTELGMDEHLGDTRADPLHIKFVGEKDKGEVYIADSADLTIEELARRINGVCGTWLEAIVETDEPDGSDPFDDPLMNAEQNKEKATKRLVLRTRDGQAFAIYDGPGLDAANPAGSYAERLGISTALIGVSTAVAPADTQDWNVKYPEKGATRSFFDENMPAILNVTVGERTFECKVCNNNCPTAEKVAAAIVRQVNEQYGGTLLAWDANDIPNNSETKTFSLFAVTGEPLRVIDVGYGDPRYTEFSGGVAMQLGIAAGVTSTLTDPVNNNVAITDQTTFDKGTIRISASGHTIDVPVLQDDTLQTLSVRIREYAGDWLDVSFYDSTIGPAPDGGAVRMSLAAKDGSAVSVLDLIGADKKLGSTAHRLGFDTGLTGTVDLSGGTGGKFPKFVEGNTLTITVNGMSHVIDLYDREIIDGKHNPVAESIEDLAAEINTRFQGKDIVADVQTLDSGEKYLLLSSPWGYEFSLTGTGQVDVGGTQTDVLEALGFGADNGFGGNNAQTKGFAPTDTTSAGDKTGANYNQIVTRRTGNNLKDTDFFGVVGNLIDCVEGGNVDGISDTMIEQLDNWLNTLLKCRSQVGALHTRYQTSAYKMTTNNTNYTELWTKTVGVDLAETITDYQMASNIYEASLAAIARIMTPSLLDFLS